MVTLNPFKLCRKWRAWRKTRSKKTSRVNEVTKIKFLDKLNANLKPYGIEFNWKQWNDINRLMKELARINAGRKTTGDRQYSLIEFIVRKQAVENLRGANKRASAMAIQEEITRMKTEAQRDQRLGKKIKEE